MSDPTEAPLKAPDKPEAPLKAPDNTEQQTPFRLASLAATPAAEETPAAKAPPAEETPAAEAAPAAEQTPAVEPAGFPDLGPDLGPRATKDPGMPRAAQALDIRLLSDIPLEVTVELGRAVLTVSELLALRPGSVVDLTAGASTVDVVVNGRLVARGDVVVIEESFGVRVTEIVDP